MTVRLRKGEDFGHEIPELCALVKAAHAARKFLKVPANQPIVIDQDGTIRVSYAKTKAA